MLEILLSILFPQDFCYLCRKTGSFNRQNPWCHECTQKMQHKRQFLPQCSICGKYLLHGEKICESCRKSKPLFVIARAVGPYENEFCKAIQILKFLGRKKLAYKMSKMMAEVVNQEPGFGKPNLVIPVPISRGHRQHRGFNQSELLARGISKALRLPLDTTTLLRVKETPSQRELSREERENNLLYAFKIINNKKIKDKNILLVDDVYTTGSTSRECTRILLEAGAAEVAVITWATGVGF
jgi:competence protein ComFC